LHVKGEKEKKESKKKSHKKTKKRIAKKRVTLYEDKGRKKVTKISVTHKSGSNEERRR